MADEPFPVRCEVCLKGGYDRREHAANTFGHGFTSNINPLTSNIPFLILPSSFELFECEHATKALFHRSASYAGNLRSLRNRSKCKPGCAEFFKNFPNAFRAAAGASRRSLLRRSVLYCCANA